MANCKPLIDEDGEIREITAEDFANFKPFSSLPRSEKEILRTLQPRDSALEAWLMNEVVPAIEAVRANPGLGRTGEQVRASLAQADKKLQKAG
jgi:hypothetical protein